MKLSALLSQSFQRHAANVAMRFEERSWTYAELEGVVSALASGLRKWGIRAGDRVAFLLPNCPELVFINLACCKLGAVAVPLNVKLTSHELAYSLNHSEARLCVVHNTLLALLQDSQHPLETVAAMFVVGAADAVEGIKPFDALFATATPMADWADMPEDAPVAILYTSGTTARPKGVTHTQHSLGCGASNYARTVNMQHDDIILGMSSMAHVFAYVMKLLSALSVGATVVVMTGYDPKNTLALITKHRVTQLYGLPVMFGALVEAAKTAPCDMFSLRYCVGGGDAISQTLNDNMRHVLGIDIHQGCGMTEVTPYAINRPGLENRIGSIGTATEGMRLRLMDSEGNVAGAGEAGEIQLQSEALMAGYWHDPEATATAMNDDWFCTGDLGRCDKDGYYHFIGRSKEIIVSGGSNISPLEVEEVLFRHPAVLEVAAVGKPDAVLAETVAVFVVLKSGHKVSTEELLKFAEPQLATFKLPKTIIFLDTLPHGATGKVHRKTLKDSFTKNQ